MAGEKYSENQKEAKISQKASIMKQKNENRSSDTTDKKERKKASSPVKYNNKLKDGDGWQKVHRKHKEAEKYSRMSQKQSRK